MHLADAFIQSDLHSSYSFYISTSLAVYYFQLFPFKRKYFVLRTVFYKNKGIKTRKKE